MYYNSAVRHACTNIRVALHMNIDLFDSFDDLTIVSHVGYGVTFIFET